MENFEVLQKAITETKYLSQENTYRYRPIMRFFYRKYEQAQNWLYKEEIYEELQNKILNYTIEDLERDLDFLVSNLSLTTVQDVKNINSLEDFKYKRFRYQLTDYAITIEEMTIYLEEMEVKVASLSPKRFEILKNYLQKLNDITQMSNEELSDLWGRITNEYKEITQNYQDFMKKFQESKTEELLQSTIFLEYKNKMIQYLKDFISGYLSQVDTIKSTLLGLEPNFEEILIQKLENYQRETPKINPEFNYEKFNQVNLGKWKNIYKWFINPNDKCEGDRLLALTSSIITQITKCATSLIELHGNMIQRKEEYKHICKMFDRITNIEKSNQLSLAVFGLEHVNHYKGISRLNTDSLINSYEVSPIMIPVEPVDKKARQEKKRMTIQDKTLEKKKILEEYEANVRRNYELLKQLVKSKKVLLEKEVTYNKEEREFLLNLISRAQNKKECKDPVFGLSYQIEEGEKNTLCTIKSEDGIFLLPSLTIHFLEELYE